MPKGRQPIIKPAFQKLYGSSWIECIQNAYSGLTLEEAHEKFHHDIQNGILISKSAIYAFFMKEIDGFSFASKGKGKGKHKAILQPALEKAYGEGWEEGFKKTCEGLTLEEATERINKDLNLSMSSISILGNAKKLGVIFKTTIKVFDPNAKKRGKPSAILPLLLKHFITEDALKAAFHKLDGMKQKDIAESINNQAGTNIPIGNFQNLINKYGIQLSCKRIHKTKTEEKNPFDCEIPEGSEVKKNRPTSVNFTCQTKGCSSSIGQLVDVGMGLALRARRCPECNKFGTYKGQYRNPDGRISHVILSDVDGITCEVEIGDSSIPIGIE